MRLWHYELLPYLPDMQLKGQWRECCLIADGLAKNGTPNHLLVNKISEFLAPHFLDYTEKVCVEMRRRKFILTEGSINKFSENYADYCHQDKRWFRGIGGQYDCLFDGWHDYTYLRVCMANLYEKHFFGISKSRITDEEWQRLCEGYKEITGEDYKI